MHFFLSSTSLFASCVSPNEGFRPSWAKIHTFCVQAELFLAPLKGFNTPASDAFWCRLLHSREAARDICVCLNLLMSESQQPPQGWCFALMAVLPPPVWGTVWECHTVRMDACVCRCVPVHTIYDLIIVLFYLFLTVCCFLRGLIECVLSPWFLLFLKFLCVGGETAILMSACCSWLLGLESSLGENVNMTALLYILKVISTHL